MPLVRIEILKGRPTAERRRLLHAVHAALVEAFAFQRMIALNGSSSMIPRTSRSYRDSPRATPSWKSPPSRADRQPPSGRSTRRSSATSGRWGSLPATSSSFSTNLRWRTGESAAANPLTRSISASDWMSNPPPSRQLIRIRESPDELKAHVRFGEGSGSKQMTSEQRSATETQDQRKIFISDDLVADLAARRGAPRTEVDPAAARRGNRGSRRACGFCTCPGWDSNPHALSGRCF